MYAFDPLYLNGFDLRSEPLITRRELLSKLIQNTDVLLSESFEGDGSTIFALACEMGVEGIVSKRQASRYRSGRTNDWIKVTCQQRETLIIAGYALKENRFDGLYLGRHEGRDLVYAGKVDHGFSDDQVADLQKKLKAIVQKSQAYTKKIVKPKAVWVKPVLLAEVEYRAKSAHGKLRHPSFRALETISNLDGGLMQGLHSGLPVVPRHDQQALLRFQRRDRMHAELAINSSGTDRSSMQRARTHLRKRAAVSCGGKLST